MRKRLKNKRRSCPLCKPHKTKGANRWKAKEFTRLKEFEQQKREKLAKWENLQAYGIKRSIALGLKQKDTENFIDEYRNSKALKL